MSITAPITIELPKTNTAEAWNSAVKEGAEKAGVELPQSGAAAAAAAAKKEDEPTVYESSIVVNGKTITVQDADPKKVIEKLSAAVQAAQAASEAAAAPAAKVEEPKPAFTEAELFDISLKVQKGDVAAVVDYIDKSGALDQLLAKRGINPEQLKQETAERRSEKVVQGWKDATDAFKVKIAAGESDYPGGEQNTQMMGFMIASLGLGDKPSVESFELAWAEMKKRNMFFPVTKQESTTEEPKPKKQASSSTAVGSHGTRDGHETRQQANEQKFELDVRELTPKQYTDQYNELIRRGAKPENIKIVQ